MRISPTALPKALSLTLLAADDPAHQEDLKPGSFLRQLGGAGIMVRLPDDATPAKARNLGHSLSHQEAEFLAANLQLTAQGIAPELVADFIGGLWLGTYRPGKWKSDKKSHVLGEDAGAVYLPDANDELIAAAERALVLADVQQRIMALVDAPANIKRPQFLAQWALDSGQRYGYHVRVLDKEACEAEGMGALLAVNRGSEDPARFIIMEYCGVGGGCEDGPTAIIGKGITFDTGGLSIKPSQNLHLMKSDMGGAAATFGALEACARLGLPVHLIGIVPSTDNSVDALSIKPSDVITGYSGKTIEIIDTDAEGRLVMSDGLSYANRHYSPKTLIDVATLTGSAVRTFGYECAATLSKNEELMQEFREAGTDSGELVWPLPPWDSYRSSLDSDVADIKNYSGRPIAGAIDAFKFLEFFTDEHPRYIHFDIAGVALKQGPFAKDRQATGYGMRLFVSWLEKNG
ncbi:M17 family metallopeptidase [Lewinella sp. W8]|uniref:leucyl aminopeptidase family protein n=1 Tax=Lewinella sp. W8 TaxID=2528208 RepID=UPI00106744F3|nr:leucyl aminopeptidase family protein [Lewinella sp. W8]MTB52781.1 leucyl aminopeptidase [Lewinella sp. W8]